MKRPLTGLVVALCAALTLPGCSMFQKNGQPTAINNDIPEAATLDKGRTKTLFLAVVDGLRKQGQAHAALAYLDDFDRTYPGDPSAMLMRAQCLSDIAKRDEAGPIYRALLNGPYAGAANAGLGNIAGAAGDWPQAVASFQQAVQLEPTKAEYANDLGFAEIHQGQYDAGLDMLSRASELEPDNRFIRNNLILAFHLSGKNAEAARMIDKISDPADRQQAKKLLALSAKSFEIAAVQPAPVRIVKKLREESPAKASHAPEVVSATDATANTEQKP